MILRATAPHSRVNRAGRPQATLLARMRWVGPLKAARASVPTNGLVVLALGMQGYGGVGGVCVWAAGVGVWDGGGGGCGGGAPLPSLPLSSHPHTHTSLSSPSPPPLSLSASLLWAVWAVLRRCDTCVLDVLDSLLKIGGDEGYKGSSG